LNFCVSSEFLKREYIPLISRRIDGWRSLKEHDTDRDPWHSKPTNSIFFVFFFFVKLIDNFLLEHPHQAFKYLVKYEENIIYLF
jgi:hypothetical protein